MLVEDLVRGILRKEITRIDEEKVILSDSKLLANNRAWEIIRSILVKYNSFFLESISGDLGLII